MMSSGGGSGDGNSPFAWLGLLKWSLAYTDGTSSSAGAPMNEEDREFLEKVMSEGIVDEGERMKTILRELTDGLVTMLGGGGDAAAIAGVVAGLEGGREEEEEEKRGGSPGEEEMLDLLRELRDIVEQIDYARAFMAMGGVPFLLGLATHRDYGNGTSSSSVPKSIRGGALNALSTMCQNNPPVQSCLLGCGHVPLLIRLFDDLGEGDDSFRADVVQALSASVREHPAAERAFCEDRGCVAMLGMGLGMERTAPREDDDAPPRRPCARLRRRSLFLLRALLSSDDATDERHTRFRDAIDFVCTREIDDEWEEDAEIREMSLAMMTGLLRRVKQPPRLGWPSGGVPVVSKMILRHKNHIGTIGVRRIRAIRDLEEGSEEKESATLELEEWENLMVALAEAGNERGVDDAPPLVVCDMHEPLTRMH
ncbi:hypothetical protein ACHAW5_005091 [Stephanodiscus triporus]|uniref:Protein HGH1 homolog n=1 Tax=Stephanodiscus triporus TaxID=2934178 RepID=A0ABD3MGX0_9STRA